ncbi:MAG TPA: dynamin family protein [Bacillus sp. (in: firmicutes)]|uniref:dynamin family protein n=1 Tax=Bacillus litorisediminis TaxID=2922713 RepID=UPI001FB00435|nr:dynamin family protein [Bacillus litorisediminis]HWO76340.1 dynamin family protein [Bacillus sp. (in: firmicutes)]
MTTSANQSKLYIQYASPLYHLSSLSLEEQNEKLVFQIKGIMDRLAEEKIYIAFCGHYSAGKSSLMNQLFGKNLLPSSPIPTSANTVKMKDGKKEKAIISYKNGKLHEQSPLDMEEVKRLCKDGREVLQVEIQTPYPNSLPKNLVFFDTPGIDSTDDAHQLATEGMLHLADIIFYMVDYHHVQSDINLQFIRQLNQHGKKVCLIINQIDKHAEEEIPFQVFKQSTEAAFKTGGAQLERIFYTSLKIKNHPFNEWSDFYQYLIEIDKQREEWLSNSFLLTLDQLTSEWEQFVDDLFAEQLTEMNANQSGRSVEQLKKELEDLSELAAKLEHAGESVRSHFQGELAKTLHNSYLMDYKTRELAQQFLESLQPHFKVGLFFSKKKTEEEQKLRETRFYEKVKEQVKTQFEWHLKQLALASVQKFVPQSAELTAKAQQIQVSVPPSILKKIYKSGASLTGQYLLQYSSDLENEVKKIVQRDARTFLEQLLLTFDETMQIENQEISNKIQSAESELALLKRIEEIQEKKSQMVWRWQKYRESTEEVTWNQWEQQIVGLSSWLLQKQKESQLEELIEAAPETEKNNTDAEPAAHSAEQKTYSQNDTLLLSIADVFAQIPALRSVAESVSEKANRLKQHSFTVTLFGAFSAGKSSFINGLLGTKLLPSSPNPMTAALTEIKAPGKNNSNRSLMIHYKTEKEITQELSELLKIEPDLGIDEIWNQACKQISHTAPHPFLQAFVEGYPNVKGKWGIKETANLEKLAIFAVKESVSCFIKKIEVFVDHPLTNAGMTLVDTPGSDSLNTRHTGVAFEHIKNSDAIIYVSYYHHAFGKADREFLIQLGRVKDTFSLDKMFFIVNAADLAETEEERTAVVEYVQQQLLGFGLRNPRLFPVSSVNRLANQIGSKDRLWDGFIPFLSRFQPFVEQDLKQVTREGAWKEVSRGVQMLESFIELQNKGEQEKEMIQRNFAQKQSIILEKLNKDRSQVYESRLIQETNELLHYVQKRVLLRSRDFFKETFNPTRLQDGNGPIKPKLQESLDEWLELIDFDYTQELRATSLRLEKFANELIRQFYQEVKNDIHTILEIPFSEPNQMKWETPSFGSLRKAAKDISFQPALQLYKNAKAFFEKNEKEKMLDKLADILEPLASAYQKEQEDLLIKTYGSLLAGAFEQLKANMNDEIEAFISGQLSALNSDETIEYESLLKQIQNYI